MRKIALAILMLSVSACSSRSVKDESVLKERMFPNGTYQHQVHVDVIDGPPQVPKKMDMRGVVSLTDEELKVLGLGPMGFTLFRLTENRKTGELKKEFFIESLKKGEPFVLNFYHLIKDMMLSADKSPRQVRGQTELLFEEPDVNGIPKIIRIEDPHFKVKVDVVGYEI